MEHFHFDQQHSGPLVNLSAVRFRLFHSGVDVESSKHPLIRATRAATEREWRLTHPEADTKTLMNFALFSSPELRLFATPWTSSNGGHSRLWPNWHLRACCGCLNIALPPLSISFWLVARHLSAGTTAPSLEMASCRSTPHHKSPRPRDICGRLQCTLGYNERSTWRRLSFSHGTRHSVRVGCLRRGRRPVRPVCRMPAS